MRSNVYSFILFTRPEERYDAVVFYTKLSQCLTQAAKIVLGDSNAKVGQKGIFSLAVGRQHYLLLMANRFRRDAYMLICSTMFQNLDVHKPRWLSPDRLTYNQIDNFVRDGRYNSNVPDVRKVSTLNIDLAHQRLNLALTFRCQTVLIKILLVSTLLSRRLFFGRVDFNWKH